MLGENKRVDEIHATRETRRKRFPRVACPPSFRFLLSSFLPKLETPRILTHLLYEWLFLVLTKFWDENTLIKVLCDDNKWKTTQKLAQEKKNKYRKLR